MLSFHEIKTIHQLASSYINYLVKTQDKDCGLTGVILLSHPGKF